MLLILNNDFIRQINYRSMISRISHSETDDKISRHEQLLNLQGDLGT